MSAIKKFLDADGVAYLAALLDNYPDNEILSTVITAIQEALETKADTEDIPNVPAWALAASKPTYTANEVGAVAKTGDTMSGDLSFADNKGIELSYSGYKDKLTLMGYSASNSRIATFSYSTELRNIKSPSTDTAAANKQYVDNKSTIKTIAGTNNVEYNLIGTETSNTNSSAVSIYNPTLISFAKTNDYGRLTLGSTSIPGRVRIYSNASSASGFTDIISNASSTNERTITLPDATGTIALTSDIPNVPSWALASSKPTYTAAEVGATTSSDVSSMISSAVSGITSFSTEIVQSLPASGVAGRIYFLAGESNTNDIYEEYIYVNNTWEKLGNFDASAINLEDYLKKETDYLEIRVEDETTGGNGAIVGYVYPNGVNAGTSRLNLSFDETHISGLVTPVQDYEAANKLYVDNAIANQTHVTSFNGQSGAITYIPPVTSVNGQTGAVTLTIPSSITNSYSNDPKSGNVMLNSLNSTSATLTTTSTSGALTFSTNGTLSVGKSHSSEGSQGKIALSNSTSNSNYTTITPSATAAITLTLPATTGTLALTSQIPTITVTQTLTSGTAIATINGTTIYAPSYTAANGVSF